MKLLFKQRVFSWLDSYDIFDEYGNVVYQVKGQLAVGHKLVIYDELGYEVGIVRQQLLTFLPKFELYKNGHLLGCLRKEFTFLIPRYYMDYNGWKVEGSILEWDYAIVDENGYHIASISKELLRFGDTYVIDVKNSYDALDVLMFVLAIDAEKCSRNHN